MRNTTLLVALLIAFFSLKFVKSQERSFYISDNLLLFIPNEVKYVGATDMDRYYSGVTVSKLFLGWSGKNGLSGDGLNRIYQLGTSYTYLNSEHYVSIYPQLGYVSWWMAYIYFRPEPMFNVSKGKFDYINLEVGAGLLGNLSLFCFFPIGQENVFMGGFKFGFAIPYHPFFKEGKNGWR